MDFSKYPKAVREAIHDIAQENATLEHPATSITAQDCLEHAKDKDVLAGFWIIKSVHGEEAEMWGDMLDKIEALNRGWLFACINLGHGDALLPLLRSMMVNVCADWLAYEAQKRQDDPDSGIRSGGNERPFDPFLEERRAFTRNYNASLRASRVSNV